jgi:hypothetical protein
MKLRFTGVGAEPKRVTILAALLAVAGYLFISNRFSANSASRASAVTSTGVQMPSSQRVPTREVLRVIRPGQQKTRAEDLKPSRKPKKDEEIDRSKIDPTVHAELLAKLKEVKVQGAGRSLFELGAAPAALPSRSDPSEIVWPREPIGPPQPPPPTPKQPFTAPPIPLKFYGFVNQTKAGVKRAFFLEGDDIFIASEGQLVKHRYKIVRIGVNSALVEDIQVEATNSQQWLMLVEEIKG